jgi:hypothetical protein
MDSKNEKRLNFDPQSNEAIIAYYHKSEDSQITAISPTDSNSSTTCPSSPQQLMEKSVDSVEIVMSPNGFKETTKSDSISQMSVYSTTSSDSMSEMSVHSMTSPNFTPEMSVYSVTSPDSMSSQSSQTIQKTIRSPFDPKKDFYSPGSPNVSMRSSPTPSESDSSDSVVDQKALSPANVETGTQTVIKSGQDFRKVLNDEPNDTKEWLYKTQIPKKPTNRTNESNLWNVDGKDTEWLLKNVSPKSSIIVDERNDPFERKSIYGQMGESNSSVSSQSTSLSENSTNESIPINRQWRGTEDPEWRKEFPIDREWLPAEDPIEPRPAVRDPEWRKKFTVEYEPIFRTKEFNDN